MFGGVENLFGLGLGLGGVENLFGLGGDDKFNGTDFEFWRVKIQDFLYATGLSDPLSGAKPESMTEDEWKVLDRKALNTIRMVLSRDILSRTADEKTTAGLMASLAGTYEMKPTAYNQMHLMRQLLNLKMEESDSATEHLVKFGAITTKLSFIDIKFDDAIKTSMVLCSLPDSWSSFVTALTLNAGKEKLKYHEVFSAIVDEETRRRYAGETSGNASSSCLDARGRGFKRSTSRFRARPRIQEKPRLLKY